MEGVELRCPAAEVSHHAGSQSRSVDSCCICLEPITERAITVPCNHYSFDFTCITLWLTINTTCPLCKHSSVDNISGALLIDSTGKTNITAVEYDWRSPDDFKTHHTSIQPDGTGDEIEIGHSQRISRRWDRSQRIPRRRHQPPPVSSDAFSEATISRRRFVYKNGLYSLHVGTNRISKFKDFTPHDFLRSTELQTRARKWIRRELHVFDFLGSDADPSNASASATASQGVATTRRANNAEFLLEYIVAVLRTVDIKDSSGRADAKLADFLGTENARLFLHELEAWLRSPYVQLEDWDRAVQYAQRLPGGLRPCHSKTSSGSRTVP